MSDFLFLSQLFSKTVQISCLSLDHTWVSIECGMVNTMYCVWSYFDESSSSELSFWRKSICFLVTIWQNLSDWCATNKIISSLKFNASMLLSNLCCQVSRSAAGSMIKMSSYADFRFKIGLLSMHEQEKENCFPVLLFKRHWMIENCKMLSVSAIRCFSSFSL